MTDVSHTLIFALALISQSIVFVLAIIGVLFKSTKTDDKGRTVYNPSGLPELTRTGKLVVTLVCGAFLVSMVTIFQKNASEAGAREAARTEKIKTEAYNAGMEKTLNDVFKKSKELRDEQKTSFQDVLGTQKKTGEEIANGITSSADLLRGRIDSSSSLLNGGIRTSIGLLNHSAAALASVADPITTINISWLLIEIPFTDPRLANYRNRVEPLLRSAVPGRCVSMPAGVTGIFIESNSKLLPDRVAEPEAYNLLEVVVMDVFLFKNPLNDKSLTASADHQGSDLNVPVLRHLKTGGDTPCANDPYFWLFYDVDKHRAFIFVKALNFNRPALELQPEMAARTDASQGVPNWNKSAGGQLIGVPDLASSQIMVRLGNPYGLGNIDVPRGTAKPSDIAEVVSSVRQESRLVALNIGFSGERLFRFVGDKEQSIGKAFKDALMIRRVANGRDFPFYVATLPDPDAPNR